MKFCCFQRSSQEHKDACEFWNLFLSLKNEAEILESVTRASEATVSWNVFSFPFLYILNTRSPFLFQNARKSEEIAIKTEAGSSKSVSGSGAPLGQVSQNLTADESRVIIANVLFNLLSVHEDDRYIAEIFKRVPSAQSYPIYYEVIKNPIDFWMIFKKLKVGQIFQKRCWFKLLSFLLQLEQYDTLNQFEEDITLLINNAKTFNEPGSQVFKDALTIKKLASSLIYKFQIEK